MGHRVSPAKLVCLLSLLESMPAQGAATAKERRGEPAATQEVQAQVGGADCVKLPPRRLVKVTLKPGSSLADLVGWVSAMTCKRFVVPDELSKRRVTLLSPTPITAAEGYRAFLSALEVMGLALVPSGRYLKVVSAKSVNQAAIPTFSDDERETLPADEGAVTQLVRLKEAPVGTLQPLVQRLLSPAGAIDSFAPTNTLIITDRAINLRRIVAIVEQLDLAPQGARLEFVPLQHADATEVARLIGEVGGSGQKDRRTEVWPALRTLADRGSNAVILVGDDTSITKATALIARLDVADDQARPRLWNYDLRHADAEQLATALGGVLRGGGGEKKKAVALFEGPVEVSVDKANNSLLIVAAPRDYLALRPVLQRMDQPRRQVFVEAYVLEVDVDKDRELGLTAHAAGKAGEQTLLGGLAYGEGIHSLGINPLGLMGLAAGVQGPVAKGSGQALGLASDIPAFGLVLRALQRDKEVDLLSSPHILTTDNEEAELAVGQEIPILVSRGESLPASGGQQQQALMLATLGQRVDREKVELNLTLTPTIGEGNTVRLKVKQEVQDVAKEDFGNGLGPSTSRRLVRTVVNVRDGQTVVVGGLITDRAEKVEGKVPLLGDIPILGWLFRYQGRKTRRANLLVVLTPYVIRDHVDLERLYRRKIGERREFLQRYTAFRERTRLAPIDFERKHGLLAEIDRLGRELEQEAALRRGDEQNVDDQNVSGGS